MAEAPGGGYKERYLKALEDQERQEKQFNYQLELLRKTLTYLGAAAHGLDKSLDAEMLRLKEKMRGASGPQVVDQLERVQKAVSQFERARDTENANVVAKMKAMLECFLVLHLPDDLHKKIQQASKSLPQNLHSYRVYPLVLGELTLLQESALQAAMNPPTSFWQRLKGGRSLQSRAAVAEEPELQRKVYDQEISEESLQLAPDVDAADSGAQTSETRKPLSVTKNYLEEDSFEVVAQRICRTLAELVDSIEPNDIIRHKVELVRSRIERGMDWFALSVTLEDIRDILMQRYLDVDREFSQYLLQVNKELQTISQVLGVALEQESSNLEAADALSEKVHSEVAKMHNSMSKSADLNSLKQAVTSHLGVIQQALTDYRQQHEVAPGESLSDQLKALLQKVESIENESSKTKELLEEERYKATHDSLTGLPNREAYNERAFQEFQRFTRYSRPLGIAVCDIDYFKTINDNYGHQAGDKVLKLIARLVSTRLRKVDFVARYGGEEFVILLPETTAQQSFKVLDKIRAAVSKAAFRFGDNPVKIGISFGITAFIPEDSVESAFERADKALYRAKAEGRNRCVVDEGPQQA
ncbi:diguanylate cyclase [Alteromonadaceae bacterium 2753L.S.0a.02]|nr:diguanylate cyclase [Alteromonadaceae bacterium 2753L.S.0a.02]